MGRCASWVTRFPLISSTGLGLPALCCCLVGLSCVSVLSVYYTVINRVTEANVFHSQFLRTELTSVENTVIASTLVLFILLDNTCC